jgi:hypothetical protein
VKFALSRGGASAAENKRSRERGIRERDAAQRAAKKEELRRLRKALALAKKEVRAECANRRKIAKHGRKEIFAAANTAIREAKDQKKRAKVELTAHLERITEECRIRMDRATGGGLSKSVEALAAEIKTAALARKHAQERARERPAASSRERREEEIEAALRDVEAIDPSLVDLVRRHARTIQPRPRQSLGEAYAEWIAEHGPEVEAHKAKSAALHPADLMCAHAIHEAEIGNPDARIWAAENCKESGKGKPVLRRKLSAAERTIGMFGEAPRPVSVPPFAMSGARFRSNDGNRLEILVPGHPPTEIGEFYPEGDGRWRAERFHVMSHDGPKKYGFGSAAEAQNWIKEQTLSDPGWGKWFGVATSAPKPKRGKKAPRGQQGISIGAFGADFLDANANQGTLGAVPF